MMLGRGFLCIPGFPSQAPGVSSSTRNDAPRQARVGTGFRPILHFYKARRLDSGIRFGRMFVTFILCCVLCRQVVVRFHNPPPNAEMPIEVATIDSIVFQVLRETCCATGDPGQRAIRNMSKHCANVLFRRMKIPASSVEARRRHCFLHSRRCTAPGASAGCRSLLQDGEKSSSDWTSHAPCRPHFPPSVPLSRSRFIPARLPIAFSWEAKFPAMVCSRVVHLGAGGSGTGHSDWYYSIILGTFVVSSRIVPDSREITCESRRSRRRARTHAETANLVSRNYR